MNKLKVKVSLASVLSVFLGFSMLTAQDLVPELNQEVQPLSEATGFDLMIRDAADDSGDDRSMTQFLNDSPDIWIRRKQDGQTYHQNPVFTTAGKEENYVYVRITNVGEEAYDPSVSPRYLHLNWAKGSPTHSYKAYTGEFIDSTRNPVGSAIKSILLSEAIGSYEDYLVCVPYKTHGYSAELAGGPFSILASISDKPTGLSYDITRKYYPGVNWDNMALPIRDKKTLAVKSMYIPETYSQDLTSWTSPIYIQNQKSEKDYYAIYIESGNTIKIYDYMTFTLEYPNDMLPVSPQIKTTAADTDGMARIIITGDNPYEFNSNRKDMSYAPLKDNAFREMKLTAKLRPDIKSDFTSTLRVVMVIKKYPAATVDDIIGSYTFACRIVNGKFTDNIATVRVNSISDTRYKLTSITPEEYGTVEWYDENDNLISSDSSVVVDGTYAREIKCRTADLEEQVITLKPLQSIKTVSTESSEALVTLNCNPCEETELHLTSIQNPRISKVIKLNKDEHTVSVGLSEFGNDFIVIDLVESGQVVSSRTIR